MNPASDRHLSDSVETDIRDLARRGYGIDDILVRLELPKSPVVREWVKDIVIHGGKR